MLFEYFTQNCLLMPLLLTYVVVAEDEELFQFVEDLVPGHGIHFGFRGMEHSSEHVLYGSNEFFRTTFSKPAHFKVTPSITMVLVT